MPLDFPPTAFMIAAQVIDSNPRSLGNIESHHSGSEIPLKLQFPPLSRLPSIQMIVWLFVDDGL